MRARRRAWSAILGLVLLVAGAGCAGASPGVNQAASQSAAPVGPAGGAAVPAATAPRVQPIRIVHSTRNGSQAIGQVLIDSGLLAENGLEGTLLHVDGPSRAIAALVGGDVDVALMGGESALSAAVEGAPVLIVGGFLNRRDHIVFAVPEVADLAALRGKRVGVNAINAADMRAVVEAFQYYGLDPQDVLYVPQAGGPSSRLAGLQAGAADAIALQPPQTVTARELGLRELVQTGKLGDRELPVNAVVASRAGVADRPDVYRGFLRAMTQGVHLYQTQPETVLRALASFFALDLEPNRAVLEDTRAHYAPLYPRLPYPPLDGYRVALEELAETNPRATEYRLADAIDDRFVREIAASGLEQTLYGR
jgi:NitT/TauT family transport system substrate-binding protein